MVKVSDMETDPQPLFHPPSHVCWYTHNIIDFDSVCLQDSACTYEGSLIVYSEVYLFNLIL